jgi:6-phosphogluconolactonase (cycloisomerase 2 family)
MYSEDGVTWVAVSLGGIDTTRDAWRAITYGNGRFVAVGYCSLSDDCVMYSDDGIEWTSVTPAGDANTWWEAVTYGNGRFVAVARDRERFMYSDDGVTWTAASSKAGGDDSWWGVGYGNGLFVAVGECRYSGDCVATSPDGDVWTARSAAGDNDYWQDVTYVNGEFVAVGCIGGSFCGGPTDTTIMTSPDGITWATDSAPAATASWYGVTAGAGKLVGVGYANDTVMYADAGFGEDTPITLFVDENATTSSSTANTLTFGLNGEAGGAITADLIEDTLYLHKPSRGSSSNEIWLSDADFYDAKEGGAGDRDLLFIATTSTTTVNADLRISSSTVVFAPQNLVVDGDFDNQGTFFAERGEVIVASVAYDVASARVTDELDVSANGGFLEDIRFSSDGTRMYIAGNAQDDVDQYSLAVPWDITTATYDHATDTFNGSETNNNGLAFSATGTFMYVLGAADDEVDQYVLGTPWDVSSAAYLQSTSTNTGKNEDFPRFVDFSSSGHKMYLGGTSWDEVFEYDLSTPWDVSTAAYVQALDLGTNHNPYGITLSEDGTVIAIAIRPSDKFNHIAVYSLSTPWDLSSASLTNELNVDGVATDIEGIEFRPDGSQLFALSPGGGSSGRVYTFQLDAPQTFSGTFFATSSLHDFTIGDTATISLHTSVEVDGDYTNDGAVERGGGAIILTGTSTIGGNGMMGNLRISGTATSAEDSYTVENLTIDSGAEYVAPAAQLTVTGEYTNDGQATSAAGVTFTGGDAYGVGNMYPSGESLDVSPQSTNIQSLTFGLQGRKLYVMSGPASFTLYEYDLMNPYDLSTASYTGRSAPPVGYDVHVSEDGNQFFVLSDFFGGYDLHAYRATSSFNVSTLESATSSTLVLDNTAEGLFIDRSGTRVYVAYFDEIQQYELAEKNNLDTASFVASTSIGARDLYISDDGTRLGIVNSAGFREYILSTPWDITTATWTGVELAHNTYDTGNVLSLHIAPAANRTFLLKYTFSSQSVEEFIMGAEHDGTLTGTSALGDVTFTSSTTHTFLDNASTSNFTVQSNATVTAPSQLTIDGEFVQEGSFDANSGTVYFVGASSFDPAKVLYATSTFVGGVDASDIAFNDDGTLLFVVDPYRYITEFTLSTPYDISGATITASTSLAAQANGPAGIAFNDDGTKLFVAGYSGQRIDEYTLSTPYDITTQSYVDGFSVSTQDTSPRDVEFSADGFTMFVLGATNQSIYWYSLGTAYDVSTASYVSSTSVSIGGGPRSLTFSNDGERLFVVDFISDTLYWYDLPGPYDLTTKTLISSRNLRTEDNNTYDVEFSADGQLMFVLGESRDSVYQYDAYAVHGGSYTDANAFGNVVVSGKIQSFALSASTSDFTIASQATFLAPSTTFEVAGDFINDGSFDARSGEVLLSGNGTVGGANTDASNAFHDLTVTGTYTALATTSLSGDYTVSGSFERGATTLELVNTLAGVATYEGGTLFVSEQESTPRALAFNDDGTKLYIAGPGGDAIDEWALSTPWDVSSGSYTDTLVVGGQENNLFDIAFNDDGTKLYVVGWGNDAVDEWALSTPWDVSSGSYTDTLIVSSQDPSPASIAFSSDGTKLFVAQWYQNRIDEWSLAAPWDVSTGSFVAELTLDTPATGLNITGITFSDDGTKLYVLDYTGADVHELTLGSAFDIFDATYIETLTVIDEESTPSDIAFNTNHSQMFVLGFTDGAVDAWTLGSSSLSGNLVGTSALNNLSLTGTFPVRLLDNASTSDLTLGTGSLLDATNRIVTVEGDYSNDGILSSASSSFVFAGTLMQTATGTLAGTSAFNDLTITNTSGTGATQSVVFGAPVESTGSFTMGASSSAQFLAGATSTFATIDWQGTAESPVWLRSSDDGTAWILDVNMQNTVERVNVKDSDATPSASSILVTEGFDAGNNTNWIFSSATGPQEWNSVDWTFYDLITIDAANIDEDLIDFPVYVNLADLSTDFWSTVSGDGGDIRVTTDAGSPVELPRELVFIASSTQAGELHFKADSISSTTDTSFRIWYNGSADGDYDRSATYGSENVWSEYAAVYHFSEDPSGGQGAILDSTGNANHGTASGTMTSADLVASQLGTGIEFDGNNDFIIVPDSASLDISGTDLTISTWYDFVSNGTFQIPLGKVEENGTHTAPFFAYALQVIGTDDPALLVADAAGTGFDRIDVPNAAEVRPQHYHGTYDGTDMRLYLDGTERASTTRSGALRTTAGDLYLGANGAGEELMQGILDEVRIASTTRSSAWIRAEYINQSTTTDFYSVNVSVGNMTISEPDSGLPENAFGFQNKDDVPFYGFKLAPSGEDVTVEEVVIDLRGIGGVDISEITDAKLYRDHDNDGELSAGDEQVGGAGVFSFGGGTGSLTFSTAFTATTTQNYLVTFDTDAIDYGDVVIVNVYRTDFIMTGVTSGVPILPTVTGGSVGRVVHIRSSGGGGSGISGNFSTLGAPGAGVIGGGVPGGAGEELGGLPNFEVPTANGSPFNEWSGGGNVYISDGAYAQATADNVRQSLSDFLYSIPGGNEVTGIEVKLEARATSNGGQIGVQLSWDGGVSSTTLRTVGPLTTTDTIYTIGGTSDDWGRAWVPADFSDANFRVRLVGLPGGGNVAEVDAISVRIYNQTGGGGAGGGAGEI